MWLLLIFIPVLKNNLIYVKMLLGIILITSFVLLVSSIAAQDSYYYNRKYVVVERVYY